MPVNLYYTQKVRGFQQEKVKYSKESVELRLKRTKHQCSYCGSTAVTVEPVRSRALLPCVVSRFDRSERAIIFLYYHRFIDFFSKMSALRI